MFRVWCPGEEAVPYRQFTVPLSLNNGPPNDQVPEIQMPTNQACGTKKENPEPCKQTQPCAFRLVEDMLRQMEGRVFQ